MLIITFLLTTFANFSLSEPLLAHLSSLPVTLGGLNPSSVTTLMNKQYQVLASPQQVPVLSNLAYSINSGASDSINSGSGDLGGFLLQDYPSRTVVLNSGMGESSVSGASQGAGGFFPTGAILQATGSSPILLSAQNVGGNGFSPISGSASFSAPTIHFPSNGISVAMNHKSGGPGLVSHVSSAISNPLLNANVGNFISNNNPNEASVFPSETGTSGLFLSNPGSALVSNQNNRPVLAALMPGVGVMGATSNGIGTTRPSSTNFEVVGSSPSYQSQLVELIMPRPGSFGDGTSTHVSPQKVRPSQTQTMEVPCILRVPAPVQITMRRGTPQVMTSGIPSSFNPSPETMGALRPSNALPDPDLLYPIAAPTPSLNDEKSSLTKDISEKENLGSDKGRAELQLGHPEAVQSESQSGQELARNGFPIMYAILPSSISPAGNSATLSSSPSNKKKSASSTSSSSRPSRGKNPYFNVNKRKHFEFYEYF